MPTLRMNVVTELRTVLSRFNFLGIMEVERHGVHGLLLGLPPVQAGVILGEPHNVSLGNSVSL